MDETIGAKGGYNDRRRTLIITNKQKEKLKEKQQEKELKELEEKVKKQQIYTLIKSLPIAIGGGTFKILYDINHILLCFIIFCILYFYCYFFIFYL